MIRAIWILAVAIVGLAGISAGPDGAAAASQSGVASFYWQGQMTASGERFNPAAMTAAHKSLPFGTRVRVTHLASGRSVVVRINDRGPFVKGRIIDLSRAAAGQLGMQKSGVARVRVEVLGRSGGAKSASASSGKRKARPAKVAVRARKPATAARDKSRAGASAFVASSTARAAGRATTPARLASIAIGSRRD